MAMQKRKLKSDAERATLIQSYIRMHLTRRRYKKMLQRVRTLIKANQCEMEIQHFEQECLREKIAFQENNFMPNNQKFTIPFEKKASKLDDLRNNAFYSTIVGCLAELGNLDILAEDPKLDVEAQKKVLNYSNFSKQRPQSAGIAQRLAGK